MAEQLHYYAQRRVIHEGSPVAQQNSLQFGTRRAMERQYCLFRANALEGDTQAYDTMQMEWGTVETGYVERKVYVKESAQEPNQNQNQGGNEEPGEGGEEEP